jgi:hypothetical protein
MTKKTSNRVVLLALWVPSALELQLNQYRVNLENMLTITQANVRYVNLAFFALLHNKEALVQRAHIVKEMLQPVKDAKLDIIVDKVDMMDKVLLNFLVQMALTKITLINLVVSHVLVDTIARIKVRWIHINIHVKQDILIGKQ